MATLQFVPFEDTPSIRPIVEQSLRVLQSCATMSLLPASSLAREKERFPLCDDGDGCYLSATMRWDAELVRHCNGNEQ